ncbi:MAG: NADH-quinone oxidoreductase subunit H [Candidatus Omnitrophica bacterium]|nr:NADH-quinone oxidoreductase subunit H [Candidatus Omnitrophota bacterium]
MMTLNNIILITGKTVLLALFAPLVSGIIKKIKNNLRMRKGPGILQPYYDIQKLFLKDEVVSKNTSWIFHAAPAIVFASCLCASFLIFMAQPGPFIKNDLAVLIAAFFVLGLGRFFLALAGLDAGSSFGGMGSSREMFISSFAEPAVFIAVFALCMGAGNSFGISRLLGGLALLMAAIAETSRIPVDNQETHLELTMVHEAMVLEYSGRSLALIELAAYIKQMLFFTVLSWYFFIPAPAGFAIICLAVALIEISVAKMRLFRVVDFLSFAFFIALLASIAAGAGF